MSLDPSAVGAVSESHRHRFGWQDVALYAHAIGATRAELAYLYERHAGGMRVFPTYAVVPAYPAVIELLQRARAEPAALVHAAQRVVAHQPLPAEGTVVTTARLSGLYDLKRFARLAIETRSTLAGEPAFDTEWSIVVRDGGGFGGPRPPRDPRPVRVPRGRAPDWVAEQPTSREQALLYRLCGDPNPLHVDDELAREAGFADGAILHGLCTYGFVARAVVRRTAGGDARRLQAIGADFRRPVWPGDTLVTRGYRVNDTTVAWETAVPDRAEAAVASGWADVREPSSALPAAAPGPTSG